ncbi:MAG: MotA/TolQ/ExbB proton channel family protein [Pseudomonadota bacterium]|nr:MotA/TolQ/ExbB proton channel family protein [Pseudomonadota bacterium]
MKAMRPVYLLLCWALAATVVQAAESDRATSLEQLLERVEQGMTRDRALYQQRINEFRSQVEAQEQLLNDAQARRTALEQESEVKEGEFRANEERITELEEKLNESLGELRELFGVVQQVAADTKAVLGASVTSSQYPGREDFLDALISKAGSNDRLPAISDLERLWFEEQREMVATGRTLTYSAEVVSRGGERTTADVVRVGAFNVVRADDGRYLTWEDETNRLVELVRQPAARYVDTAEGYVSAPTGERADFWLDPSRGALLSLLIRAPDLRERIDQGGVVGYIILALGVVALLLALERLVYLAVVSARVHRQMRQAEPDTGNPLGRVLAVYAKNRSEDNETLELKVGEAVLSETPRLTRFLPLLKIISVVAPLLGLLGTVTGMINTFQAMTLFGTGDPKLMAGGISQALVTTVLGLAVAIPAVLLHTLVNGRSRALSQVLERQAIGLIAEHSERDAATQTHHAPAA